MFIIPNDFWQVKKTKHKGRGVFLKKALPAGKVIGDYIGRILTEKQIDAKKELMGVWRNDKETIWPDPLNKPGVHFINHSCTPNCAFYPYKGHMIVVTLRKIFPGEELSIDYMMDPPLDYEETDYQPCKCESKFCRGTMHTTPEHADDYTYKFMLKKQGKYAKKLIVPFGAMLKPFKNYPKMISDHPVYNLFGAEKKKPVAVSVTNLPSARKARSLIRDLGTAIKIPKLKCTVYGVARDRLIVGTL